jgi:hypothetical protein
MNTAQRNTMFATMEYLMLERLKLHYPPIEHGLIIRQQTLNAIVTMPQLHAQITSKYGMIADCSQTSQVVIQVGIGRRIASYDVTTEWFLDNLPHYHNPSAALIGGPVVWGNEPGHHMAIVYKRGRNPTMFSHGHDPAELISFQNETIAQANRPWTFTSIASL